MNAIIYFGAQPTNKVQAERDLKSRGIDLVKSPVSKVTLDIVQKYEQPGFAIYTEYLAASIHAAATNVPVSTRQKKLWTIPEVYKSLDKPLLEVPSLIFAPTRDTNDPSRIAEIKVEYQARETVDGKGRKAFSCEASLEIAQKIQESGKFNLVTATTVSTFNIQGYLVYVILHRILDAFLRVHQYAGRKGNKYPSGFALPEVWTMAGPGTQATMNHSDKGQKIPNAPEHRLYSTDEGNTGDSNYMIYGRLPTKVTEYKYPIYAASDIPSDYVGLILAFEPKLSEKDFATIPRVIQKYFKDCLAEEMLDVLDSIEMIKSSWGNLGKTKEGERLSHMFRCVEVALETQCFIRPMIVNGMYRGMVLLGGGYTIRHLGEDYTPVEHKELVAAMGRTNPHEASLMKIYSLLRFENSTERDNKLEAARRLRDVNRDILENGFAEKDRIEIKEAALNLSFKGDDSPLVTNAYNVTRVLEAIADPDSSELDFPMHPIAIDSNDRDYRLMSAFGSTSFSFMVPGGTKMDLDGEFAVTERKDGRVSSRGITRIGAVFVRLEDAVKALKTMKEGRYILNPYAGKAASYRSTGAFVSEYSHESKDKIVVALRKVVGVEGKDTVDSKKRKLEESGGSDRSCTSEGSWS